MSGIPFSESSVVLNLYIDKENGISSNFFIWLWFLENIVKIKNVREAAKPWNECEVPRSKKYNAKKEENFRAQLKCFCDLVLSEELPFEIHVADESENKDISVFSKVSSSKFSLLRQSLFGIVADIGMNVKKELENLKYGSFYLKDGKAAVLYGPLSLANNRCGSDIAFGEISDNMVVHKYFYRKYSVLKVKSKSLKDTSKNPKIGKGKEVLIKYLDGKRKYVCNCQEHTQKRLRKQS